MFCVRGSWWCHARGAPPWVVCSSLNGIAVAVDAASCGAARCGTTQMPER
jgi:hypothetical protein